MRVIEVQTGRDDAMEVDSDSDVMEVDSDNNSLRARKSEYPYLRLSD